jgi:NAD(P)-dependent dehydrogenase (short-subunit alcohol dehydrogenase family)
MRVGSEMRGVAVVTGGAKGIGRAVALRLAADGFDIAILDVDDGSRIVEEVRSVGRRSIFVRTDVADHAAVEEAGHVVGDQLGTVTALINSAGIYPRALALDIEWAMWQRVLAVNLGGTFLCCKTFGRAMLEAGGGSIVNISSTNAHKGPVQGSHYAASKGGILSLTRSLAREWAPAVRVNTIMPGLTDTDQPRESGATTAQLHAKARAQAALGRIAEPDDIAAAVSFLVSSDSRYVTGASLCVDGGCMML